MLVADRLVGVRQRLDRNPKGLKGLSPTKHRHRFGVVFLDSNPAPVDFELETLLNDLRWWLRVVLHQRRRLVDLSSLQETLDELVLFDERIIDELHEVLRSS